MKVHPATSRHQKLGRCPAQRRVFWLPGLILAAAAAGCANQPPLERWRMDAEEYIAAHASDANLLRDYARLSSSPDDRPALLRFSTLHVPAGIGRKHDVLGVLVGFPRVGASHWYVFLVATARVPSSAAFPETAEAIVDIRLIGLRLRGDESDWRVGESDPVVTRRYLNARAATAADDSAHMLFPGRTDVFTLDVSGPTVVVTERHSGARWTLALPAK